MMSVVSERAERAIAAAAEDDGDLIETGEPEGELLDEGGGVTASAAQVETEPEYLNDEEQQPEQQLQTETEAGDDETGETPWYDQGTIKSRAASYGLPETELASMRDEAEFNRYTRWIDQQYQAAMQRQNDQAVPSQPATQATGQSQSQSPATALPGIKDGLIDQDWINEKFDDEDTRQVFVGVNSVLKTYSDQLAKLNDQSNFYQEYIRQQEQTRAANEIHDAIDRLSPEIYGDSSVFEGGQYKPLADENAMLRGELIDALQDVVLPFVEHRAASDPNYKRPSMGVLVERAARLVHAERLDKLSSEKKSAKLKKQSVQRRPVVEPSSISKVPLRQKEPDRYLSVDEEGEEIANDPEVKGLYRRFQEENGAAA